MDNKLCNEHSERIIQIDAKLDNLIGTNKIISDLLQKNINFQNKLIGGTFLIFGTIVLAAFGLSKVIPFF
jgi:hypothetical protein